MDRSGKEEVVEKLSKVFKSTNLVVVAQFSNLTVAEATDLRSKMQEHGASFQVTKNRLALRAIEGTPFKDLSGLFTGSTAIAYSDDAVAAAKVVVSYSKKNEKIVVVGGALNGDLLDVANVKALADLPSLDELRGKIVGMIQTPATRVAGVLQAPAGQLARVLGAYSETSEAG